MAHSRVLRPGHVGLRVLDIDAAVIHYRDRVGLQEAGRDACGRRYFKAWDEHDAWSVVLREADTPGMDCMGFKVSGRRALDDYAGRLREWGCPVEWLPEGELPDCGERLRFETPSGHPMELYAEKKYVGNGLGTLNPDAFREDVSGMAPHAFDHCALYGPAVARTHDLFVEALDFDLTESIVDGDQMLAAFVTCSNKAHDVAFIHSDQPGKLHHASFTLGTWEEILHAADLMSKYDIPIDIGPTRHGITRGRTIYFFDPSGNRNEVFCGDYRWYPDRPPIVWTLDKFGKAIFYHDRQLNERFLTVVT